MLRLTNLRSRSFFPLAAKVSSINLSTAFSALYKQANDNKYASLKSAVPVLFMHILAA